MSENAAAQEAAELALDEAGHNPLARLRAGEEGLELPLDDAVEDTLLGAASVEGVAPAPAGAMRTGSSERVRAHPRERLPAPFRPRDPPRERLAAAPAGSDAGRSRPLQRRRTGALAEPGMLGVPYPIAARIRSSSPAISPPIGQ